MSGAQQRRQSRHGTRSSVNGTSNAARHMRADESASDEVTDEEFWSNNINIDTLIGPAVVFHFPSQISTIRSRPSDDAPGGRMERIRPIRWRFTKQCLSEPAGDWSFQKQTSPSSTVHFNFPRQLDGIKPVRWDFPHQCDGHDVDVHRYWQFCRQIMMYGGTVAWNFHSHDRDPSKILWFFPRQSGSRISPERDWYFKKQLGSVSTVTWGFDPQTQQMTPVSWRFLRQTPSSGSTAWRFMRQTAELTLTPACIPRQLDTLKNRGVRWGFTSQSNEASNIRWNLPECLKKDIHKNSLNWGFERSLSEGERENVRWLFVRQMENIEPMRWNVESMTAGLGETGSQEEVLEENKKFKEIYLKSFGKSARAGRMPKGGTRGTVVKQC